MLCAMMLLLGLMNCASVLSGKVEDAAVELLCSIGSGGRVQPTLQMANAFAQGRYDPSLLNSLSEIVEKTTREDNLERALHRWTRRQWWSKLLPEPYNFPLLVQGPTKLKVKRIIHACLLPHEWFGALYKFPELFHELMTGGDDNLRFFWEHSKGTDWYERHPVVGTVPPEMLVPIGMHGDDVGVYTLDKVRVVTWGSVATSLKVLDTRLIFTGVYDKHLLPEVTMEEIFRVLTWSLKALALGVYPDEDHTGRKFSKTHHPWRFNMRGKEIAGGYVGAWSEMRGDWKFLVEALGLFASFSTAKHLCHLCKANRVKRRHLYTNTRRNALLRRSKRTHAQVKQILKDTPGTHVGALWDIPGFHIWRVWVDALHALDLGILQKLSASTILELTERLREPYAGPTKEQRVRQAYADYREWCRSNKQPAGPIFDTTKWFSKGRYPEIPMKQAKGAIMRTMQYWLLSKCQDEAARVPTVHNLMRRELWANLVRFDLICRERAKHCRPACAGRYFSPEEKEAISSSIEQAMDFYVCLANEALENDRYLWKLQPQMHMITHMAYDMSPEANPRRVQCYADEDMVGRFKKLVVACHSLTAGRRAVLRYIILVGLRWWSRLATLRGL